MKNFCDEVDCESNDRQGVVQIGESIFRVCERHIKMIRGEDQIGLVKRAHITVIGEGMLKISVEANKP